MPRRLRPVSKCLGGRKPHAFVLREGPMTKPASSWWIACALPNQRAEFILAAKRRAWEMQYDYRWRSFDNAKQITI